MHKMEDVLWEPSRQFNNMLATAPLLFHVFKSILAEDSPAYIIWQEDFSPDQGT